MNGIMLPLCGNMTSFQETSLSFFDNKNKTKERDRRVSNGSEI
ncbi:unnamed protein product [Brassica oleracea]